MYSKVALLLAGLIAVSTATDSSPHAHLVDELLKANPGRYSNDVYEDARLSVPELITKYGYKAEVHNVMTEDGYILEMHRIPHGRDQNNNPMVNRPIVFIQHGLLSSSADWVLMGPGLGLGYILAEEGFDVWMGNARGTHYSRKHSSLDPDRNVKYWDFSWEEIGRIDLATMIDYALRTTNRKQLHYIGHSQGTTAFWVLAAMRPEYNEKIASMHAMAPVCYMEFIESFFLRFIARFSHTLETLTSMVGIGEFLPNSDLMSFFGENVCSDDTLTQPLCTNMLFLMIGTEHDQLNATMFPVMLGHTPAGASSKQFAHYGQQITDGQFRRYDYGWLTNLRQYSSSRPPDYDLSKITTPVFLHYSEADTLAHVKDVDRLFKDLGRPVGKFLVSVKTFSHLDFMWGLHAKELVYNRVINLIKAMETSGSG